jgi:hypothetical protein
MFEPKDLLLVNEQLRRSNRRWKALALAACSALILIALFGSLAVTRQRYQAEAARRQAMEAMARAELAARAAAAMPGR